MSMTSEEMFEVFQDFNPRDHEEEVEERWGGTEEYRQSKERTTRYTKQDWLKIKEEGGQIYNRLLALMEAGTPPSATEAMDAAEAHRQHISRWFYDCSRAIHRGLGQGYVDDRRFTAFFDKIKPGLAQYCCDSFRANSER